MDLDTGCGTSYLRALSENDVFGIDISKGMIWQCRDKNLSNLIIASYEFLPFKPGIFDLILCINASHYTIAPQKVLKEFKNFLKEEEIILTALNLISLRGINLERRYTVFSLWEIRN